MTTNLPGIIDYCVVLERLAMAAGQTRWYVAEHTADLEGILADVVPGSAVSIYFDRRLKQARWTSETATVVLSLIASHGDCVVAVASPATPELSAFFISGDSDLNEFLGDLEPDSLVYFGPYPLRDNDGVDAVSFVVPDSTGRVDLPH